ncbi:hypothetical protein [Psychrobacillus sp.]|nr:hypothetical protein [Psychrobacillus sp.]
MGKSEEADPQPPQLCLLRRVTAGALFTFDPEGLGTEAGQLLNKRAYTFL